MISADDPYGACLFEHAAAGPQPGLGEGVVGGEVSKLIPLIAHRVHPSQVGPPELPLKLQVVRWICEDKVHAILWQPVELFHTITLYDVIQWQV